MPATNLLSHPLNESNNSGIVNSFHCTFLASKWRATSDQHARWPCGWGKPKVQWPKSSLPCLCQATNLTNKTREIKPATSCHVTVKSAWPKSGGHLTHSTGMTRPFLFLIFYITRLFQETTDNKPDQKPNKSWLTTSHLNNRYII